ncbi:MAG: hypothetical protein WCD21_15765 [Streptomyces sp.]
MNNKTVRHIAVFCGILMFAVLARATWIQYLTSEGLAGRPENRRSLIEAFGRPLGDIIVDGRPITGSEPNLGSDLRHRRIYTDGALHAPITGYLSQAQGATLLEGVHRDILTGQDPRLRKNVFNELIRKKPTGGDIITTINSKAQKAAYEGLTGIGPKAKGLSSSGRCNTPVHRGARWNSRSVRTGRGRRAGRS